MKVLLTIEEYKERIIGLVMDVANKTINPNGDDYFKFEYISWLVGQCLTDNFHCVDVCNQMYINTFGRDRNGRLWCRENMQQIDEEEAEEFNSQEWYEAFNKKARKYYEKQYYFCSCEDGYGLDDVDTRFFVEEIVSAYFKENGNEGYHISLEAFKRLYGHEYEVNKEFKCE